MAAPTEEARSVGASFLVIGYGNDLRSDDGAGRRVAALVEARQLPGVRVLSVHQLTPELASDIAEATGVMFADAVPAAPGAEQPLRCVPLSPAATPTRTLGHQLDPESLLHLARDLWGRCPPAWLLALPASVFDFGETLSPRTETAVAEALPLIEALLA